MVDHWRQKWYHSLRDNVSELDSFVNSLKWKAGIDTMSIKAFGPKAVNV